MTEPVVSTMVTLDRERTLRLDWNAVDDLSNLSLILRGGRAPAQLVADAGGRDLRALEIVLWAACRHEDRALSLDQARAIVRRSLRETRVTTVPKLIMALAEAVRQSEPFRPDDEPLPEAAPETVGNAPRTEDGPSA